MIEVDKLFQRGYYDFSCILQGKTYNIRLYLQEEVKGFCHAAISKADLTGGLLTFLDKLILKQEFEVYHVLLMEESTYHPVYIRLYNLQVEIKEPGLQLPQVTAEGSVMTYEQHRQQALSTHKSPRPRER